METTPRKSIHPLMATAAIAVIVFSAVGIGAITGVIPTSKSNSEHVTDSVAQPPVSQPAAPVVQQPQKAPRVAEPAPKAHPPAQAPARPVAQRPAAQQPAPVQERTPEPVVVREPPRVAAAERSAPQPQPVCYD